MRRKRRIETTIETHEVWVIRKPAGGNQFTCADCMGKKQMLAPEEAARLMCVSLRAIYRWVEAGSVHFMETQDGRLFVCLAPLTAEIC